MSVAHVAGKDLRQNGLTKEKTTMYEQTMKLMGKDHKRMVNQARQDMDATIGRIRELMEKRQAEKAMNDQNQPKSEPEKLLPSPLPKQKKKKESGESSKPTRNTEWTPADRTQILKSLAVVSEMQKSYGRDVNPEAVYEGWKMLLQEDYSAMQVICALKDYMKLHDDVPTAAGIRKILRPETPVPSYAQYQAALDARKRNPAGWSPWSYEAGIIRDYEAAYAEKQDAAYQAKDKYDDSRGLESRQTHTTLKIGGFYG